MENDLQLHGLIPSLALSQLEASLTTRPEIPGWGEGPSKRSGSFELCLSQHSQEILRGQRWQSGA